MVCATTSRLEGQMTAFIGRREFITLLGGAAGVWPIAARAQRPDKPWRLGLITGGSRSRVTEFIEAFLKGMSDRGYIEGQTFVTNWLFAEGNYDRFASFATDLVRSQVDVIVVTTPAAIPAVQQATKTIPIVMVFSTDPVGNGFVASLAHPGSNTTGLASSNEDTSAKQVELLASFVPRLSRIGFLLNPRSNSGLPNILDKAQLAAKSAHISMVPVSARDEEEFERAFAQLAKEGIGAVMIPSEATFMMHRVKLAELALNARLPSMFVHREYVEAGGLMSYGEDLKDYLRYAAVFVDKILKGAKPADLPVEQPTKFRLTINRKTAKALGLTIPLQLYVFADEVIE
jgi:putative ABC transport system substrate-binding protein